MPTSEAESISNFAGEAGGGMLVLWPLGRDSLKLVGFGPAGGTLSVPGNEEQRRAAFLVGEEGEGSPFKGLTA